MSKKNLRIQASTTTKTYVSCKIAANEALDHSKRETKGSLYFQMMAATFAAFTVEAFLNHVGEKKVKDWRSIERRLGPREKLLVLRQMFNLTLDESRRPFQTLGDMLRVRDALAHGRTEEVSSDRIVADKRDETAFYPEPVWKMLCRPESVTRMVADAEAIVRNINDQLGLKLDPFSSPGHGWSGTKIIDK